MSEYRRHAWPETPAEARELQERLAGGVERRDRIATVGRIAGADVGFEERGRIARAAVVVLDFATLQPLETSIVRQPTGFPYVPGLLSFREAPVLLAAIDKLTIFPDLLLCDGQGIAHPRRFGLACHLGLLLDLPTIGVAKSRLVGRHDEPGPIKGDWMPLLHGEGAQEETIGAVLRSRTGVKPLYVSIGHRVSLASAIALVLRATPRFRLPETTRLADRLSKAGAGPLAVPRGMG
ncbi:MAG: deoxyribonuclease V [Alphaproteobacteria bacterium]|nr:deoxyribonuclease V [Alphaproteobacteria bacterium]